MTKTLISACLLGKKCRYDGKGKLNSKILSIYVQENLVPVCPEQLGGLPTPRIPAEQAGDKVYTQNGDDITANFEKGAQIALEIALAQGCEEAILKAKSPSCGCGKVYDGNFTGTLIEGNGVFAQKLLDNGFSVKTEEDF